jgi:23S rRNA (adenine-N6)-dimethyltransferase
VADSRPWGHFQLSADWAQHLVAAAGLPPRSLVLDIGAGHGAVTAALTAAGQRVIAVELHSARAAALRRRYPNVTVVRADAAALRLPGRAYHVVANPPFAVTSPLLRRLLQPGSRLVSAHLVLQEAAALRWAGTRAPAAARWRREFDVDIGGPVPRRAFHPAAPVRCRTLTIRRRTAGQGL